MVAEFDSKVVMITGASGGLGQAVVRRFYEAGASLALVERRQSLTLEAIVADTDATADRSRWLTVTGDATDKDSMQAAVAQAGVKTVVSFVLRWNPMFQRIKKHLAAGDPFDVSTLTSYRPGGRPSNRYSPSASEVWTGNS